MQHQSTESIFNISNRAPILSETDSPDKRDGMRAVLARIGCGQVLPRRRRVIELGATGRAILECESRHGVSHETLFGAGKQLMNRAGAQLPVGWES